MLSANTKLFHFLLDPSTNQFSDEYIHYKVEDDCNIRTLLEMMVIEYANRQEDTQVVLKSLTLSFLIQIARQYVNTNREPANKSLSEKIVQYIGEHVDTVTLKEIAKHFSYHPNYVSTLLHREVGKSFSEILLELRMERAVILLKGQNCRLKKFPRYWVIATAAIFTKPFGTTTMFPRENT